MKSLLPVTALSLLCALHPAFAHVTLEQARAEAGGYYKAVLRVPHGCDGSPTKAITVHLPPGVVGAKPMPKPGWKLETQIEKLAKPYMAHGKSIDERVAVISWSGGRLLDSEYDEFVLRASLPAEPGMLRFRVLQECEQGRVDWSETAAPGKRTPYPAPVLEVTPAATGHHHH